MNAPHPELPPASPSDEHPRAPSRKLQLRHLSSTLRVFVTWPLLCGLTLFVTLGWVHVLADVLGPSVGVFSDVEASFASTLGDHGALLAIAVPCVARLLRDWAPREMVVSRAERELSNLLAWASLLLPSYWLLRIALASLSA